MLYLNSSLLKQSISVIYLTLTNVVFESWNKHCKCLFFYYLTLTNVVFELVKSYSANIIITDLTLTNVVFESGKVKIDEAIEKFNFNKCCI